MIGFRAVDERARWGAVAVVCLGMMLTFLNITATISGLQTMQQDLGLSNTTLVWIPSVYALVVASAVLSAGSLGDLWGRRRAYLLGTAILASGSVITAAASSSAWVLVGQGVAGIGGALILPNSLTIVSGMFPDPYERTRAITVWSTGTGLGLAVGSLSAGAVLLAFSWHAIFVVNAVAAVLVLVVARVLVPESTSPASRLDVPGLVLGTAAIASLTFWVIDGSRSGFGTVGALVALAATVLGIVAFVLVELRTERPMLNVRLFRSRAFTAVMLVGATAMFGFTGVALLCVLYLQRVEGLSAWSTGLRLLALMATYIVVSSLVSMLLSRCGFRVVLTCGLLLVAAGATLLLRVDAADGPAVMTLGLVATAVGLAFLVAPATAAAMISVAPERAGMASAGVNMFRQIGSVLGSSVLGSILTARFVAELPGELSDRSIPPPVSDAVVAAAENGGRATPPGAVATAVQDAVQTAFTTGYHSALTVTAITFVVIAVPAALFVRNRPAAATLAPVPLAPVVRSDDTRPR